MSDKEIFLTAEALFRKLYKRRTAKERRLTSRGLCYCVEQFLPTDDSFISEFRRLVRLIAEHGPKTDKLYFWPIRAHGDCKPFPAAYDLNRADLARKIADSLPD